MGLIYRVFIIFIAIAVAIILIKEVIIPLLIG